MDARPTNFGSADAKARFSELLARVEGGETITIHRHGKAVAQMMPVHVGKSVEERRAALERFLASRKEFGPKLQPGDDVKEWINEGRR